MLAALCRQEASYKKAAWTMPKECQRQLELKHELLDEDHCSVLAATAVCNLGPTLLR